MAIGWSNALIGLLLTFIATNNREQIKSSAPKEKLIKGRTIAALKRIAISDPNGEPKARQRDFV